MVMLFGIDFDSKKRFGPSIPVDAKQRSKDRGEEVMHIDPETLSCFLDECNCTSVRCVPDLIDHILDVHMERRWTCHSCESRIRLCLH